jgi:hypothetical protein
MTLRGTSCSLGESSSYKAKVLKQVSTAVVAVAATAALGMTAPATSRTPMTTKGLAPMVACMTAHQAWVWEKAILSVPAVVLVPPRICP